MAFSRDLVRPSVRRRGHDAYLGKEGRFSDHRFYRARTLPATNKLLQAAQFELPEPGRWQLEVQVDGVHGPPVIAGQLEAAAPLPRWRELWPWIAWPALAIALFGIHQVLARRWSAKAGLLPRGGADGYAMPSVRKESRQCPL